jgi:hypothetical protein
MDMRTVVSKTARIAHVEAFPAEGDDLPVAAESTLIAHSTTSKADTATWHCCLAHLSTDTVVQMVRKGMVKASDLDAALIAHAHVLA